jgi:hypothetical protein
MTADQVRNGNIDWGKPIISALKVSVEKPEPVPQFVSFV